MTLQTMASHFNVAEYYISFSSSLTSTFGIFATAQNWQSLYKVKFSQQFVLGSMS